MRGSQRAGVRGAALNLAGIVVSCIFLFPLYWILASSLKTNAEIFQVHQTLWPLNANFVAYIDQLRGEFNVVKPLLNSFIIAPATILLSMALAIPAAYGMARFSFKGKKAVIMSFLVTQMLPSTLILTPLYLLFARFRLINNYLAPIIADSTIAIPFIILFVRTYFIGLPKGLEDSARIDGCSRFSAFLRIILPISTPGLITAGSFSFIFAWNDLMFAITFMNNTQLRPLTAQIYHFMGKYGIEWNRIMAFGVILVLPVIIIFVFLQKYIIGGLTSGAVKG
jgi:multiple sugar transport system permease protein